MSNQKPKYTFYSVCPYCGGRSAVNDVQGAWLKCQRFARKQRLYEIEEEYDEWDCLAS